MRSYLLYRRCFHTQIEHLSKDTLLPPFYSAVLCTIPVWKKRHIAVETVNGKLTNKKVKLDHYLVIVWTGRVQKLLSNQCQCPPVSVCCVSFTALGRVSVKPIFLLKHKTKFLL